MPLTVNQLGPFFQAVVLHVAGELQINTLVEYIKRQIRREFRPEDSNNKLTIYNIENENPRIFYVLHEYLPTWLNFQINPAQIINKEYDLLIVYQKEDYIFLHCQCNFLLEHVLSVVGSYNRNRVKITRLKPDKMHALLDNAEVKYKALGIRNIFGAGGTAPEAKSYFGRNADYSLTPLFDTGFGFNYCFGSTSITGSKQPFGCSIKKSKVWRTWTQGIPAFVDNCDEVYELMTQEVTEKSLELLVSPKEITDPSTLEIIEFYMDYTIPKKGSVVLFFNDKNYYDWYCCLNLEVDNQVIFSLPNEENVDEIRIEFRLEENSWVFDYVEDDQQIFVKIADEGENLNKKRKIDLVHYLNEQCNFTILFTDGVAFRDEVYWEDNRLKTKFTKAETPIVWKPRIDITKEEKEPEEGKITILQGLEEFFDTDDVILGINDNAANEIADIVILKEKKIILIHAKASGGANESLRVGDVQIVSAQAMKNLRFFIVDSYKDSILERLHGHIFKSSGESLEDFSTKLRSAIIDYNVTKECWIVQPGISKRQLNDDEENKIHTILNIVDSACLVNNVTFRLIASP